MLNSVVLMTPEGHQEKASPEGDLNRARPLLWRPNQIGIFKMYAEFGQSVFSDIGSSETSVEKLQFTISGNQLTANSEVSGSNSHAVSIPEPSTWALMLGGFGVAGAASRLRQTYRLVEIAAGGARSSETFRADDDHSALAQALEVAEGVAVEVWKDEALVARFTLMDVAPA